MAAGRLLTPRLGAGSRANGGWQPGSAPTIGLHRPGIDTRWAFTWEHKPSKLQLNGSAGVTFNFENTETDYKTGNEFHFEWAIGREFATGLVIGIVGYDYRQRTGDSGSRRPDRPVQGQRRCDRGRRLFIGRSLTRPRSSATCVNITNSMPKTGERRCDDSLRHAALVRSQAARRRFKGLGPAACRN
jgi:Putative MetA-pathway of phenol degradation